jgi:hypothetical protein
MTLLHVDMNQTPATYFNLPPQLDRNVQPQLYSQLQVEKVVTPGPCHAHVLEAEFKREADRRILFQKVANGILGSPNGYRKVEVLIIRWDESIDEFKGHTQEVHT